MEIVVTAQAADLHLSKAGLDVGWYQLAKHKASHQRAKALTCGSLEHLLSWGGAGAAESGVPPGSCPPPAAC